MAHNKEVETFLPLQTSRRRWSDREKAVELPLFPGYVFCRLYPTQRLRVLTVPGAVHFVGLGKTPIAIEEAEIAALQTAVRSGLKAEPCAFLERGERVRLEDGPLAGVEGIFMGDSKDEKIIVSISLLKRSVAIAIERHWATPVKPTAAAGRQSCRAAAI